MKLILTRHGETVDNVKGILQGHNPGELTEKGIEQAKKLALKLKEQKIDVIYSSDLKRAADTAKEILKLQPNTPIFFVKELREGNCGGFTGKKESEIDWGKKPNDAESMGNMQQRINSFLTSIYEKYKDKTVLFVGHNGINKSLVTVIDHLPANDLPKIIHMAQASISIFDIEDEKKYKTQLLNSIDHLE